MTLAADVARAYSDLGQAHIVHDLSNEDLKRTQQMLDLSQRRLSSGIDSQYQFQQTESLEASSEANLIDAEKRLQQREDRPGRAARQRPGSRQRNRPAERSSAERRGVAFGAAGRTARASS